jgi:hypothetical protein
MHNYKFIIKIKSIATQILLSCRCLIIIEVSLLNYYLAVGT